MVVSAGSADRYELPVEVELLLPTELASKPVRAFALLPEKSRRDRRANGHADSEQPGKGTRLVALLPVLTGGKQANIHVYLGVAIPEPLSAESVSTREGPGGMVWIENDQLRLLLGPEGGHVYRWEVKALEQLRRD